MLNAAILLNGERPVQVTLKRLEEYRIIFESADMDVHGEFERMEDLQSVGDPFDSFVLQKAALLACGVIPASGGDLETVLKRLGGGIWMDTEVIGYRMANWQIITIAVECIIGLGLALWGLMTVRNRKKRLNPSVAG